jgi:hypothetical protein
VFTKIVWANQGDHVHSQTFRREMAQGIGVRRVAAGLLSRLFDSARAYSQLPTAQQVASQIVLGWTSATPWKPSAVKPPGQSIFHRAKRGGESHVCLEAF